MICSKCENKCKQLNLKDKKWICNDCFYGKQNKTKNKKIYGHRT